MDTLAVSGLSSGRKILESLGLRPTRIEAPGRASKKDVWNGFITHLAEGGTLEATVELDFTYGRTPSLKLTTFKGKQREVAVYDLVLPDNEAQHQWEQDVCAALGYPPGSEVHQLQVVCDTRQVAYIKATKNLQHHTQNALIRCLKECRAVRQPAPASEEPHA